jgi:DNA repair exonuclease SbcCD ATPase subunit
LNIQQKIGEFKTCPLDLEEERRIQKEIKKWKDYEDDVDRLKQEMTDVKKNVTDVKKDLEDVKENVTDVEKVKKDLEDVKANVTKANRDIDEIKRQQGTGLLLFKLNIFLCNEFFIIEISLERLRKECTRILTNTMTLYGLKVLMSTAIILYKLMNTNLYFLSVLLLTFPILITINSFIFS